MRVVLLGTYDLGKPRTRLLRECLRIIDPDVNEVHFDVWRGVEDKAVLKGWIAWLHIAWRMVLAYPVLALRYLFAGRHDVVVIGYMGLFDMLALAPLAKLRGKPVVWDVHLSVYDAFARDRALREEGSWQARILRGMERLACRMADRLVLDSEEHARYVAELHDVSPGRMDAVFVGAEEAAFEPVPFCAPDTQARPLELLFYGQFIPLQGIDTIVDAAIDPRGADYNWTIIGRGQEAARIDARLAACDVSNVRRIEWVEFPELRERMAKADICLGIFGETGKSGRVIANKVYQAILANMPLITRDSAAMRELVTGPTPGLYLVAPGDPNALLDAIDQFAREANSLPELLHDGVRDRFALPALVEQWKASLEKARKA